MNLDVMFFVNSILLGVGLAMDAFSVSIANGLNEPKMKTGKMCGVAGVYAIFQFVMPMIGWVCVHTIVNYFKSFEKFVPYIALILLLYIGGKMIIENVRAKGSNETENTGVKLGFGTLIVQGIATAIDALSVGFTIENYTLIMALIECLIIAVVTFAICYSGLIIGKKVGDKISGKAQILGGVILILIGVEIFVKGVFFA